MSTGTGPAPEAEDKVSRIDHLLPFCWEIEESFWMIRVYLWNTPEFIQYRMSLSTSKGPTTRSLHPSVYRHFQYMEAGRDQNNQSGNLSSPNNTLDFFSCLLLDIRIQCHDKEKRRECRGYGLRAICTISGNEKSLLTDQLTGVHRCRRFFHKLRHRPIAHGPPIRIQ